MVHPGPNKFEYKFALQSWAYLDAQDSHEPLRVNIQAVMYRNGRCPLYEISWVHNGTNYEIWVEEWRLTEGKNG